MEVEKADFQRLNWQIVAAPSPFTRNSQKVVYQLEQASFGLLRSILRFDGALLQTFGVSVLLLVCP